MSRESQPSHPRPEQGTTIELIILVSTGVRSRSHVPESEACGRRQCFRPEPGWHSGTGAECTLHHYAVDPLVEFKADCGRKADADKAKGFMESQRRYVGSVDIPDELSIAGRAQASIRAGSKVCPIPQLAKA